MSEREVREREGNRVRERERERGEGDTGGERTSLRRENEREK